MARLLIAGLLGAAAITPLLAQPVAAPAIAMPGQPRIVQAPGTPLPPRPPMTRADAQTRVQAQFARRDVNRDGFLTAEEMTRQSGKRGQRANFTMRRMGPGGAPGAMGGNAMADAGAAFDRLDANKDGSISRAEFGQARQVRIEKRVMINGRPGEAGQMGHMTQPGGPGTMRMMRHGRGAKLGAAMLQRADTNRDGRVSLAEATGAALQHFDMMDSNRDGRITPDERAAGRAHMMQMRKAG